MKQVKIYSSEICSLERNPAPALQAKEILQCPGLQTHKQPLPISIPSRINSYCRALLVLTLLTFLPALAPAQCFVLEYPAYRKVLKVDGDFVIDYSSYRRLYKFDGAYLVAYNNYRRLLRFDGRYVVRYSDNRRIAYLDGEYLVRYSDSRRIAKLECPGQRSAMAAAAYFLL